MIMAKTATKARKTTTKTKVITKAKTTTAKSKTTRRVTFSINAPAAGNVYLAGEFNEWSQSKKALKKETTGSWTGVLMLKPGKYQYKYVVDENWTVDEQVGTIENGIGGVNNLAVIK
jgi:1,4-alpha-glucan branching enzyme